MEDEMNINTKIKIGFWFLIGFSILLNIIYFLGQTMSILSYDFAVSIGLQESVSEITEVGVAINKGFGFGDTFFYMPLFIIGIIGIIKRSVWGLYSLFGAMSITVYWPIVSLSTVFYAKGAKGWYFSDYNSYSILLVTISVFGLWGLWFLYKNRKIIVSKK